MKHNQLNQYREHLKLDYSESTATTYYFAMAWLLDNQHILDCKNLDIAKVMQKLESIKHKNDFSKHKNAMLHFTQFLNINVNQEDLQKIDGMNESKKKRYRRLKAVKLKSINDHIRVIKNKKLKLSFQAMLNSGLRVSELAQVKKEDSKVFADYIEFHFIGKGGKAETVSIYRKNNTQLYNNMIDLITNTEQGEKVFYSKSYLQEQAQLRGFACHDLRRAYAKVTYNQCRNKKEVQQLLRHRKLRNTKIYLNSKVEI